MTRTQAQPSMKTECSKYNVNTMLQIKDNNFTIILRICIINLLYVLNLLYYMYIIYVYINILFNKFI